MMAGSEKITEETHVETATTESFPPKGAVSTDNQTEHQLSLWFVIRNHPSLVWWTFFFGVSAIGWYCFIPCAMP